jgi:hypothetical protein
MQTFLEELGIPFGGVKKKQLPWTTLPRILSERGMQLENWPREVPLPGSGSQLCDDNKGLNGFVKRHLVLLYEAVKSEDRPLKFSAIAHAPRPSSPSHDVSFDGAPRILAHDLDLVVESDVGGGGSLNVGGRRGREDYAEGSERPDKRPRLMGD